jgi:hypothetical protein
MDFKETGWDGADWILDQDRDQWQAPVNMVLNLWVPQKAGNSLTTCASGSFSRRTLLHAVSNNDKSDKQGTDINDGYSEEAHHVTNITPQFDKGKRAQAADR